MLESLHVKNLALMEETEVEFGKGLNILTGETGAGKSLLLGSVNLALGAKFEKDMLRKGKDNALVELTFCSLDKRVADKLEEMELPIEEDGRITLSRRMQPGKNVYRLNGETVTAKQIKEISELLLDIHGQHEHESLLHKKKHLEILDAYCGDAGKALLEETNAKYAQCRILKKKWDEEAMDESARERERALAEFEYGEIEGAHLRPGEDEALELAYTKMSNAQKIKEVGAECALYTSSEGEGAGNAISRAMRLLASIGSYDPALEELVEELSTAELALSDFHRDVMNYMEEMEFDEETYNKTENRLNEINRLKGKYGTSIEAILAYGEEKREQLEKLSDYETYMEKLHSEYREKSKELSQVCAKLSKVRQKAGEELSEKLTEALIHLNFLKVEFAVRVQKKESAAAQGWDDVEFLISTNPGEPLKSLSAVASGGELSRIMLAIKTVLAAQDAVDTLIFDEIDTGISGKTAWKVSEQLNTVAKAHQVICITHLPQIAAMADRHYLIEKSASEAAAITDVRSLQEEDSLKELARMLGSDTLTEAALENAKEMRRLAEAVKSKQES
jgi:DNA repair protein RecN (Recombination protein N)